MQAKLFWEADMGDASLNNVKGRRKLSKLQAGRAI